MRARINVNFIFIFSFYKSFFFRFVFFFSFLSVFLRLLLTVFVEPGSFDNISVGVAASVSNSGVEVLPLGNTSVSTNGMV